jgi:TatD DNase family protein
MGCNLKSSQFGRDLAQKYPSIYFASGFHPSDADSFNDDAIAGIEELLTHDKCVAVGEIGLDYYWKPFDKNKQIFCFTSQIELAKKYKLPICVHSRDATFDMVNILKEYKDKLENSGVIHCYSGSVETAKQLLDLGLYISFAGPLTFKNANQLVDVAKFVPIDRCLTETDSPYLAPHPYRGTLNSPKNVTITTAVLASIKQMEVTTLATQLTNNAKKLFYKIK